MNIDKLIILKNESIKRAIKAIDEGGIQFALVVDDDRKLLGTLTDGDIRRGILNGFNLDSQISYVLNEKFIFVNEPNSLIKSQKLMKKYNVKYVPLLDSKGTIKKLYTDSNLKTSNTKNNAVIIMAGGKGARLYPLTKDCPKPMLKIQNKPILEIILEQCIEQGFKKFYISVNYLKDKIINYFKNGENWDVEIKYLEETKPLGTVGAISKIPKNLTDPFLLINGDVLTRVNYSKLIQFHNNHNTIATMSVIEYHTEIPYGVVELKDEKIKFFNEKPKISNFINAGIYIFDPKALNHLNRDEKIDIPEFLDNLMKKNYKICAFPIHEYWLDIGHHYSLNKATKEWY